MRKVVARFVVSAMLFALANVAAVTALSAAEPSTDEIRVRVQNGAFFDIDDIRLKNLDTGESDTNTENYRGRAGISRRVKLKVSGGADVTETYKVFVDPVGGLEEDSGEKVCMRFEVSSRDGIVYKVKFLGPPDLTVDSVERKWNSEKSNPQIVTIFGEVLGDLNNMRCRVFYTRRRKND